MDRWDKAEVLITLPKKKFYGAIAMFTIASGLTGYLIGGLLHIMSMMC